MPASPLRKLFAALSRSPQPADEPSPASVPGGAPETGRGGRGHEPEVVGHAMPAGAGHAEQLPGREQAPPAAPSSDAHFRALIENILDIITILNRDGTIRYGSPSVKRVLGFDPEELNGRLAFDLIHPDDLPRVQEHFERLVQTPGSMESADFRFRHQDGSWRWLEAIGRNLLDDPAVAGLVLNSRDVTERKEAEAAQAQLAAIVSASEDAIFSTTPERIITSWNAAAERLYGYSAEEAIGQPVTMLIPPERRDESEMLEARVARGERVEQYETVRLSKDGRRIEVALSLSPLRDARGELCGRAAIARDITERRAVEQLRDEFISTVSHELRTPMNGVIGMTGLLLDTDLTPQQRDYAEAVRQSGQALLAIVNDILDLSKIDAGKLELEHVELDVHEIVDDAVGLLAGQAAGKGLELASLVHRDVPGPLIGDPGRLRQILLNLLGNAIKFTEEGSVVARASLVSSTTAEALVRFEVVDTGIGLQPEARSRIFEAFAQAHSATARKYGGTGLGLTICKRLAELMGGEIGVESEPGQGSTFWFTARFGTSDATRVGAASPDLEGARVLVVDQSAVSRAALQEQLAAYQIRAAAASDGEQALERLRGAVRGREPYDLALLERQLPGWDGLALARRIQADPALARTRLVLIVPVGQTEPAEARAAGFAASLAKPLRHLQLLQTLGQAMSGPTSSPAAPPTAAPAEPPRRAWGTASGPRILVVEDSPINQKVAVGILERLGYRAEIVDSGRGAIDAVAHTPYAAVLMDCQMPEMDGYTATGEIRVREAGTRHTPIIGLTANAMRGDRERCLAAGMDDYLSKPFRPAELDAILRRWIPPEAAGADLALPTENATEVPPGSSTAEVSPEIVDEAAWDCLQRLQDPDEPSLLPSLIAELLGCLPVRQAALAEAVAAADPAALRRAAHKLKGEASFLGLRQVESLCAQLEEQSLSHTVDGAAELLAALDQAVARARPLLERRAAAPA